MVKQVGKDSMVALKIGMESVVANPLFHQDNYICKKIGGTIIYVSK